VPRPAALEARSNLPSAAEREARAGDALATV